MSPQSKISISPPPATRIVFFGTSAFAIPALTALQEHRYNIVGIVTNPDEPAGRKRALTAPPVKVVAVAHNLPVYQPEKLDAGYWKNEMPEADLFIVAAYGKLIPGPILALPRSGALNLHPSLLPRWRGPSPIQYTILNGDTETGVTLIKIDERMDHGSVVAVTPYHIPNPRTISYPELHGVLSRLGAKLLIDALPSYLSGEAPLKPQDETAVTFSKLLKKEDGRITWTHPADRIERMIRAFSPWPGCWTLWPGRNRITRIRIDRAAPVPDEPPGGGPGYIWKNAEHPLLIKAGEQSIAPLELTPGGAKKMMAAEFLRGHPDIIGEVLV